MTNSLFFLRLKEERKRLNLTQAAAAEAAGVARETWSRYETGALAPGMEVLAWLAVSGADVHYVLTGSNVAVALGRDPRAVMGHHAIEALGPNPGAVMGAAAAAQMPGDGSQAVQGDEARLLAAFRAADSTGRVGILLAARGIAALARQNPGSHHDADVAAAKKPAARKKVER